MRRTLQAVKVISSHENFNGLELFMSQFMTTFLPDVETSMSCKDP